MDIWAREEGVPNSGFPTESPPDSLYEEFYGLVEPETTHPMKIPCRMRICAERVLRGIP